MQFSGALVGFLLASLLMFARSGSAETLSSGGMTGVPIMVAPVALFHTLASDFFARPDGTTYVQTGDIPAMWLRDSAAQTLPYVRLARYRPRLKALIRGVIERDVRNIAIDPYANAWPTTTTLAEPRQLPWPVEARRVIMRLCFAEVEAAPGPDLAAPPAPCECCAMLRR